MLRESDTDSDQEQVLPLVMASALMPIELVITLMLLGSPGDDPDGPPPTWMAALASMALAKAFLVGAGVILISVKLWLFTFGAMGIIDDAGMSRPENIVTYLVFVLLTVSTHLAIGAAAAFFPRHSQALLDGALRWLQDHNHVIMILIGLVFGVWLFVKALRGLVSGDTATAESS